MSLLLVLQLVYLSRERVSFNNMPLFSLARQMVFVINRSQQRPVSFEWHVTSQADSKVGVLMKVTSVYYSAMDETLNRIFNI